MESVTVYILIQTGMGEAGRVAREVLEIAGTESADTVTGHYDVIVKASAPTIVQLGKLVSEIQQIEGVKRTLTNTVVDLP